MLSKIDIEKELGNSINIYHFKANNIKENSVNLSASKYAWTMTKGVITIKPNGDIVENSANNKLKSKSFSKGSSAVVIINKEEYIILLPFSTTLIETEEVIAVDNKIGGTFHSKVGFVSQGTGHIATMLGPNFSGHCLVAVHNVSAEPIKLKIGETFVSVVFNYLETPIKSINPTRGGHTDKMSMFGIRLSSEQSEFLNDDWKSSLYSVKEKLEQDSKFLEFRKTIKKRKWKEVKIIINIQV